MKQLLCNAIVGVLLYTILLIMPQCSIAQDSLFQKEFLYCDYITGTNGVTQSFFTPQGHVVYLKDKEELYLLDSDLDFSLLQEFTLTEYHDPVGTYSTIEPTFAELTGQKINDDHFKIIVENEADTKSDFGYICYDPSFDVIDIYENSINKRSISLRSPDIDFVSLEVVYDLTENYYIFSEQFDGLFCSLNGSGRHLVKLNEVTDEFEYVEVSFTGVSLSDISFFCNSDGGIFFYFLQNGQQKIFKLNPDLSFEIVKTFYGVRELHQYGDGQILFSSSNGFEIYDSTMTTLISSFDYDLFDVTFDVNGKEIYLYRDGVVSKLDENFLESIIFEETSTTTTLPNVTSLINNEDYTYLYGSNDGAVYIKSLNGDTESIACEPIDECVDLIVVDIIPTLLKAEYTGHGGLDQGSYNYFQMLLNVEFKLSSTRDRGFENLKFVSYNDNFPDYHLEYSQQTYLGNIDLYADSISSIEAQIRYSSLSAFPTLSEPPLIDLYGDLTNSLNLYVEFENGDDICERFIQSYDYQELLVYLDQDCDGHFYFDDCNDQDTLINTMAFDIPDNGIDEDCSGEDATTVNVFELYSEIQISPNPVEELLFIKSDLPELEYQLYDTNGSLIAEGVYVDGLDVAQLIQGCYIISLSSPSLQKPIVKRVLKL